jgi:hypothetical protein
MPLKWGSVEVQDHPCISANIDAHNRRGLAGIDRAHYITLGVLAVASILLIVALAVVIVGVFR